MKHEFLDEIIDKGHRILYLVKFGSHLYGTNTPESDIDIKGLFLPSKESALLGIMPRHFTTSTGNSNSKNNKDDIDFQLWSLQYWLEMVAKGETNALDLLYSHTYPEVVQYEDIEISTFFDNHHRLFDVNNCNSYIGYAIGQARKYGIKGSRLGVVKRVKEYLDVTHFSLDDRVDKIIDDLIEKCGDESFCFVKNMKVGDEERPYLILCGSKHDLRIRARELQERVNDQYNIYGERAKLAEQNQGIDFKALSHAVRSLDQMEMLLTKGKIQYPLKTADKLLKIKKGEHSWPEIERMINEGITRVDELRITVDLDFKHDHEFVTNKILELYDDHNS